MERFVHVGANLQKDGVNDFYKTWLSKAFLPSGIQKAVGGVCYCVSSSLECETAERLLRWRSQVMTW